MIVKFLKRGNGSCKATIDYLLGKNRDREHATVLHGDPELTRQLADSLDFENRYTVGVLSFEESDLEVNIKQKIIEDFEKSLLCGLNQDQYNITWIEHKDKGRLELNFVIPKVELSTGRAMNPYFDKVDRERVNAFKDLVNAQYDLHDPNDPKNKQAHLTINNLPQDKKELQEAITAYLMRGIGDGYINNRKDVLKAIQSDLGLSVARITPNSISIKDPINENGRNIRLKGEIYADTFRFSQEYSRENERASSSYQADRFNRISTARTELERCVEAKRNFNIGRYRGAGAADKRPITQGTSLQDVNRSDNWSFASNGVWSRDIQSFAIQEDREKTRRISTDHSEPRAIASTSQSLKQSHSDTEYGRFSLDNSQEWEKSESRNGKKRFTDNEIGLTDAKRLYERLQGINQRVRKDTQRINGDQQLSIRADQAISHSKSRIEFADKEISGIDKHVEYRKHLLNKHEHEAERANQTVRETDKALRKGFSR